MEKIVTVFKSNLPSAQLRRKHVLLILFSAFFTFALLASYNFYPSRLDSLSAAYRHHRHLSPYKGERAIGTFLAQAFDNKPDDSDEDDHYFVAARTLVYQLLHAPNTKLQTPIPILILVTKKVRESKRQRLRDDGATVVVVDDIEYNGNVNITVERWADTFTKIRLFDPSIVPYEKVLLMDTDMVIRRPLDSIFVDVEPMQTLNETGQATEELGKLPEKFLMLASPESGDQGHPYPFYDTERKSTYLNSGLLMYSPNSELFQHYLEIVQKPELYYHGFPDQDLVNYAHRWGGPMPWRRLHFSWYINWPNDEDFNGGIAILHCKWWSRDYCSEAAHRYTLDRRWEMEGYWMGREGLK